MALVSKILACLGVISAAILLAAALDLGNIHLAQTLGIWASIPLGLFVIGSIMHIFVGGGGGDEEFDEEEFLETFKSHKSKTASRLSDFQTKLDSMSGQDNDSLAEENKLLKDQLEAIHQAGQDDGQAEAA